MFGIILTELDVRACERRAERCRNGPTNENPPCFTQRKDSFIHNRERKLKMEPFLHTAATVTVSALKVTLLTVDTSTRDVLKPSLQCRF